VEEDEMTRAFKITISAVAILGLGVGIYLGYSDAKETSSSLESTQYLAPTGMATEFARVQFMRADTDHARQAVMLEIHLLEQLEQADNTFRGDGHLWLAYVRLAMIEESSGRADAERIALDRAKAIYHRDRPLGQEVPYGELKNTVLKLDKAADNL
jgi:hypothetical protein